MDPPTGDGCAGSRLPKVSVIVPVKDDLDGLRACLSALGEQDYPKPLLQIIVVDNGSSVSPATAVLPNERTILLAEPAPGSYRARNTGLRAASGEVVAFTDADCVPSATWISQAVRFLVEHPEVDMVGGRVQLTFKHGRPSNGPELFEDVTGFPQRRYLSKGFSVTANMITRRAVFDRIGPFDADLHSGGDAEWGRRLRAAGGVAHYLDPCIVEHPARDTWHELSSKTKRTTAGVIRRLAGSSHPRATLLRVLAGQLFRTAAAPVAVFREPKLTSLVDRLKFLGVRWRVDAVIATALVRSLITGR